MALIKCPACSTDVSSEAVSCPKCGHPIKITDAQTIELTRKKWKKQMIYGAGVAFLGLFLAYKGFSTFQSGFAIAGILLLLAGFGWMFAAKLGAWWSTG